MITGHLNCAHLCDQTGRMHVNEHGTGFDSNPCGNSLDKPFQLTLLHLSRCLVPALRSARKKNFGRARANLRKERQHLARRIQKASFFFQRQQTSIKLNLICVPCGFCQFGLAWLGLAWFGLVWDSNEAIRGEPGPGESGLCFGCGSHPTCSLCLIARRLMDSA